jgi:hypothetical protein
MTSFAAEKDMTAFTGKSVIMSSAILQNHVGQSFLIMNV